MANQEQNICIRREKDNCKICYSTVQNEDFGVSAGGGRFNSMTNGLSQAFTSSNVAYFRNQGMLRYWVSHSQLFSDVRSVQQSYLKIELLTQSSNMGYYDNGIIPTCVVDYGKYPILEYRKKIIVIAFRNYDKNPK